MWAPKTLNTKSNSQGPSCFVFHRVSYLKDIPLKTHFTKLGSYTMEKNKEEKEKRQPIFFFFFCTILESFTDFSLENVVLWLTECINLWPTFTTNSPFLLWNAAGRNPTEGGGACLQHESDHATFSQNGIGVLSEAHPALLENRPLHPLQIMSQSLWHLICVFI